MTATQPPEVGPNTHDTSHNKATTFVKFIVDCCDNSGARAALRSGLGRTVDDAVRMHAYVASWTSDAKPHEQVAYYTVAALIAHKPEGALPSEPVGNIGASLARFKGLVSNTKENSIHLLARQPASSICRTATRVILPLRGADKTESVDFAMLLTDLALWPWTYRKTSRRWLQSYYRTVASFDDGTNDT